MGSDPGRPIRVKPIHLVVSAALTAALVVVARHNYLLFHSLAEVFSIVIACGIFMLAWNARDLLDNNYLLFLGVAYLFVGLMDLVHALAYKGMGVFPWADANLPTQLWIAARFLESTCLLAAPLFLRRRRGFAFMFAALALVTSGLLASVFWWRVFPDCYIEGSGLTPFKIVSEYVISGVLVLAGLLLTVHRDSFSRDVYRALLVSILLTIGSEVAFTFYVSVYGLSNLVGHLFKIASFYLIYKAIIETGFLRPHDLLFRSLARSEADLKRINECLLREIDERRQSEQDKERLIGELEEALSKVKILRGLLPICTVCKKIRDDRGYWKQLEAYLLEHSDAEFTHSLCPECVEKVYPGLAKILKT